MSPSEAQLRAALHEGEGQGLDAGLLIAHASRVRRERRRRINQAAAATLAVGVLGAGFTLLVGGGYGDQAGGGTSASQRTTAAGSAAGGYGPMQKSPRSTAHLRAAVPSPQFGAGSAATVSCPSVPDRIGLPAGVTPDEAAGPLVPADATAIRACGYPGGTRARAALVQGRSATALAATVNSAPITSRRVLRTCTKDAPSGTVELFAVDGAGRQAKPVVVTVACPEAVATNGLATRYLPVAPKLLTDLLR